jgi:hypothetical protein
MDLFTSLERMEQEISQVTEEKLQWENRLGLFWEHLPACDPEAEK